MISQNALHHAEKCRFCWMCRHLCPVQHQTGKELNTPRAKGLLLSMVNKKAQEFDKDMGQAMYECLLCDACTNDCATGYQPPLFIREARTEAVVSEVAPESVMNLIENVETTGNIYGVEKPSYGQDGTDVLVYIGEVAAIKVPEMAKHLLALLAKAGVSAKVLANEPATGVMLGDLMGYTEEVRKQAEVCAKALNETKLPVVVLDSYDAEIMTQKYPEWGCEITAGVTTATAFVAKLLEEKKLAAKAALGTLGAFQHLCHKGLVLAGRDLCIAVRVQRLVAVILCRPRRGAVAVRSQRQQHPQPGRAGRKLLAHRHAVRLVQQDGGRQRAVHLLDVQRHALSFPLLRQHKGQLLHARAVLPAQVQHPVLWAELHPAKGLFQDPYLQNAPSFRSLPVYRIPPHKKPVDIPQNSKAPRQFPAGVLCFIYRRSA